MQKMQVCQPLYVRYWHLSTRFHWSSDHAGQESVPMYAWRRFPANPCAAKSGADGWVHPRECILKAIAEMCQYPDKCPMVLPYVQMNCPLDLSANTNDTNSYIQWNIPDRHTFDPFCSINDAPHNDRTFHTADIRRIGYKRCLNQGKEFSFFVPECLKHPLTNSRLPFGFTINFANFHDFFAGIRDIANLFAICSLSK